MEQKTNMQIIVEIKSIEHAKELLDDLKALSNTDLMILFTYSKSIILVSLNTLFDETIICF